MKTYAPEDLPQPKLHGLLLGAVGPRPIAFASTKSKEGVVNLAPFSFFNVFSSNPPTMIFSPARSGRTNTNKDTFHNAKETGEVVINIVNYDIVHQMSLASSPYDPETDEFIKAGFSKVESEKIQPPRVAESPAQFECKVKDIIELGDGGGAGNLIVCEVVHFHLHENILDADGKIDQTKIDQVARMGGNWYCRAHGEALFEVDKPLTTCGVGIDQIPDDIKNSTILTGNHLGKLGNVQELPNETDVNDYKLSELSDLFIEYEDRAEALEIELHKKAGSLLDANQVEEAWKTLLSFNN